MPKHRRSAKRIPLASGSIRKLGEKSIDMVGLNQSNARGLVLTLNDGGKVSRESVSMMADSRSSVGILVASISPS
jgi:hypothetical protein